MIGVRGKEHHNLNRAVQPKTLAHVLKMVAHRPGPDAKRGCDSLSLLTGQQLFEDFPFARR